ncbi:hypothetical protein MVES1_001116 [Malassezia vespertilionis]|uniref:uncharacterized protein n=1 Tax=Malassezia vespertilionis TaxID=2020962 RepID=UPI0024B27803|nr:uncharacterized protein MVES1_001116 [Malassezia vespertilionis]WFD05782.1 hypothetical protein MVES1_001116 [Malassezia vespertilionis]
MEELLRSLRNLDLSAPNGEQVLALFSEYPHVDKQLAQQLAVPARLESSDVKEGIDAMMDAALLSGATEAMLQNYNRALEKDTELLHNEHKQIYAPKPVKRVPLKALLAAQHATIRRREEEAKAASENAPFYVVRQINDTVHTFYSTRHVAELTRVDMDEFAVPKRLEGRYVLVRVASPLSLYCSCSFVGQLPSGAAIFVSIAYFTHDLSLPSDALNALLPIGTVCLIREPYISTNYLGVGGPISGGKGAVGIRVDTPSDVQVLDSVAPILQGVVWDSPCEPPAPPTRILWRQEGPLTRVVQHQLAQQRPVHVPDVAKARVHESIRQLLLMERPGAAWREWQAAVLAGIWNDPLACEDALLKFDVLFALHTYQAALDAIALDPPEALLSEYTHRKTKVTSAMQSHTSGPSDALLQHMFAATLTQSTPRFDYAEYVGPVAVQDIPNAGRGLVLTKDVKEGTLLLFCRAIGSSYSADKGCCERQILRCDVGRGVSSTTTQVLAAARCIHAILDRPELAHPLLGLTAGPDIPHDPLVQAPYPLRWEPPSDPQAALEAATPHVSSAYINGVLRFNAFGPAPMPAAASAGDPMANSTMPHPLPAILNHACLPTVSSVFLGDMVATRALHPLQKGTQIMHQYVQGELAYQTRQKLLAKHKFVCKCGLCERDLGDGIAQQRTREELLATMLPPLLERSRALHKGGFAPASSGTDLLKAHREIAASLLAFVDNVQATYHSSRDALRPDIVDPLHLAASHTRLSDPVKAIALAEAAITASGAVLGSAQGRAICQLPYATLKNAEYGWKQQPTHISA